MKYGGIKMIKFTKAEVDFIKNDFIDRVNAYENNEEYREYFNQYLDSSSETLDNMKLLIEHIDKVNDEESYNKLVEAVYWLTDFHAFTLHGFEPSEIIEEKMITDELAELYEKFYEARWLENRWRIVYKG